MEQDSVLTGEKRRLQHGTSTRIPWLSSYGKYIAVYLGAIIAANLITAHFGPGASIFNAFALIGLDLTTRDKLHDAWGGRRLWWKMALLICAGSVISYALNRNAGMIALASFTAFAVSGAVDALVYHLLRDRARMARINGSNIFSAAADSLIFPLLAFGWPPLVPVMLGQFVAKVAGGFLWSVVMTAFVRRRGMR